MPKNKIILVVGVFIALLHILDGLPHEWESFLSIIAGLSIVLLSVWSSIDKRITLKAKAQQRQTRKNVAPGVVPPETDEFGKRTTDFYPKTGQPGRRMTDLKPPHSVDNPEQPQE